MLLSITLGSTLAAINCKLYSNGVGDVGLDKRELEEQQKKYISFNNPVVDKMAKMLENDPKCRAALFDGDVKLENLNPEKLKEAYNKAAIELAKEQQAPVLA